MMSAGAPAPGVAASLSREAIARVEQPRKELVEFVDGTSGAPEMAVVSAPRVVMSGLQLGFGEQAPDVKLAFEHLRKDIHDANGDLRRTVMAHYYVLSGTVSEQVRKLRGEFEGTALPASTMLGFEGLPSIDAAFAMDVVALPAAE